MDLAASSSNLALAFAPPGPSGTRLQAESWGVSASVGRNCASLTTRSWPSCTFLTRYCRSRPSSGSGRKIVYAPPGTCRSSRFGTRCTVCPILNLWRDTMTPFQPSAGLGPLDEATRYVGVCSRKCQWGNRPAGKRRRTPPHQRRQNGEQKGRLTAALAGLLSSA